MARKKSSAIENLMDVSVKLPWQVGVGLAVAAYLVLHYFATKVPLTMNPAELKAMGKTIGEGIFSSVWTSIASVLQYIVPLVLLVGAGISVMRKKSKNTPSDVVAPLCPKCGSSMLRRTAKSGTNSGNTFWGCSKFPACRGVQN